MNRVSPNPLVQRALSVVEKKIGTEELCRRLDATEHLVRAWQLGHAAMPEPKFLRLVDILTELDTSWMDWDEAKPQK
jgi:hypothetical protein